jgi:hypothetical protein
MFMNKNTLYLMGVDEKYGDCIIRRSLDAGHTWTEPQDEASSLIRRRIVEKGYHTYIIWHLFASTVADV